MANLQDLMSAVIAATPQRAVYSAHVTPRGGLPRQVTIRTTLPAPRVRLLVQRVAARKFPQGFSFSVRPA